MEQVNFSLLGALVSSGKLEKSQQAPSHTGMSGSEFLKAISLFSQQTDGFLKQLCLLEVRHSEQPLWNTFLGVIFVKFLADQPSSIKRFH